MQKTEQPQKQKVVTSTGYKTKERRKITAFCVTFFYTLSMLSFQHSEK
ncbi:hypothetical protein JCM19237_4654 [Photobacterium aphoticum]|uniref:Uncharacterized protein n=1 Tax=Photobacterium aphoticum TaxID=754436 RepID=A0A090QY91_9GAMM|nr:hypothetical protein JCM19237_4654 [Photobacterium aphoticum]